METFSGAMVAIYSFFTLISIIVIFSSRKGEYAVIIGIWLFIIFSLNLTLSINANYAFHKGYLLSNIKEGNYKVAFVYPAGDNVTLGLEKVWDEKEGLRVYRFPKKAFEGNISKDAEKPEVVSSGNFKRMTLR